MPSLDIMRKSTELFGKIAVGTDSISAQIKLNHCGEKAERIWTGTIEEYANVLLKEFIITPNHFHYILGILRADMESAPTVGIGLKMLRLTNVDINKSFKDACTNIEQSILSQLALTAPLPKEPNIV